MIYFKLLWPFFKQFMFNSLYLYIEIMDFFLKVQSMNRSTLYTRSFLSLEGLQ